MGRKSAKNQLDSFRRFDTTPTRMGEDSWVHVLVRGPKPPLWEGELIRGGWFGGYHLPAVDIINLIHKRAVAVRPLATGTVGTSVLSVSHDDRLRMSC